MTPNISIRLLYAFIALVDLKHFTRAAERCHSSQSAFSVMIQKLEVAVGAKLFVRDTRKVTLTPEGELFADVARTLIDEIECAFNDMAEYVALRRGRVAIAALPSLAARGIPAVIAQYKQKHPGVSVQLYDALSDQCLSMLRAEKVDFVLTAPGQNFVEFDSTVLCSDPFYLVCRRDHHLASRRSVQVDDLANCEIVHLTRSTSVRQHVEILLRNVPTIHSGLEVEHLATVAGLVEQGLGVALVPELTLFQFRQLELVAIPLTAVETVRPVLIIKRKDQSLSIAAQAFLDLIEKNIGPTGVPCRYQEL